MGLESMAAAPAVHQGQTIPWPHPGCDVTPNPTPRAPVWAASPSDQAAASTEQAAVAGAACSWWCHAGLTHGQSSHLHHTASVSIYISLSPQGGNKRSSSNHSTGQRLTGRKT